MRLKATGNLQLFLLFSGKPTISEQAAFGVLKELAITFLRHQYTGISEIQEWWTKPDESLVLTGPIAVITVLHGFIENRNWDEARYSATLALVRKLNSASGSSWESDLQGYLDKVSDFTLEAV